MPVVSPAIPIRISQRAKVEEVSGILGSAVPICPSAVPLPSTGSADQAIGSSDQRSPEDQVFGVSGIPWPEVPVWPPEVPIGTSDSPVGSSDWRFPEHQLLWDLGESSVGTSGTFIGSADWRIQSEVPMIIPEVPTMNTHIRSKT